MPRKFFRRHLPDTAWLHRQRPLRYALGDLIHNPNLWHLNRRSVSGGIAVGLFVAWIPLPIQMLTAALLTLALRANLPLGVLLTWVSNPITMPPMYWTAYRLGTRLLGEDSAQGFEPSLKWFLAEFYRIWEPLMLGSLLLGLASAGLAYGLTRLLWRLEIIRQMRRRGERTSSRRQSG
jgi:uncharacterized protein (DUF2062 family)